MMYWYFHGYDFILNVSLYESLDLLNILVEINILQEI